MSRVVVVTGASAGVGRATARLFAERGARVGLLARGRDGLESTFEEIAAAGGVAHCVPTDVADAAQVDAAADEVSDRLGPMDVWINNAMVSVLAPFVDSTADEFEHVTDVTYHGFVNGTRAALRHMLPRDRGVIVQVGSALARRGIPAQSPYCGAKHAVEGFTESVRCELYDRGSRVEIGVVQLPALNTPQFDWVLSRLPRRPQPVPPIFQPEVAALAIHRFAEHPRRQLWVGWPTARAIIADILAPGLVDVYLGWKGVAAQQTPEPAEPRRPNNLWGPVDGLHRTHGSFDGRSARRSAWTSLSLHRPTLTAARRGAARMLRRSRSGDV